MVWAGIIKSVEFSFLNLCLYQFAADNHPFVSLLTSYYLLMVPSMVYYFVTVTKTENWSEQYLYNKYQPLVSTSTPPSKLKIALRLYSVYLFNKYMFAAIPLFMPSSLELEFLLLWQLCFLIITGSTISIIHPR